MEGQNDHIAATKMESDGKMWQITAFSHSMMPTCVTNNTKCIKCSWFDMKMTRCLVLDVGPVLSGAADRAVLHWWFDALKVIN